MPNWDGQERRKSPDVISELQTLNKSFNHHIGSDETKFNLIIDKLHELEKNISNLTILNNKNIESHLHLILEMQKMVFDHNKFLYDPKDGVSIRVDRLETSERDRSSTIKMIWAAIIGITAKLVFDLFKR